MTKLKTILGNATRSGFHKPRGAMTNYHPHKDTAELFEQVQDVLDEYEDYLPMTLRQVFYRLVGAHGFPKTDKAYARLSENLNKARRAGIIAWSAIRDDKGQGSIAPLGYDDAADFMVTLRRRAERFRLDRQQDQESKLVIACEAAGMVPQLERVADEYGVPVITGGGFDSTTRRYDLAEAISEEDRPVGVLHIGDYDFHGGHVFLALSEDVEAHLEDLGGEVTFTRLAVTPEQIKKLGLPMAPPDLKKKGAAFGKTCQAEAIDPPDLAKIVRQGIEIRFDMDAYRRVLKRENHDRAALIKRLSR